MAGMIEALVYHVLLGARAFGLVFGASVLVFFLNSVYNISALHPLSKYPGPLLWRASRLPASWHHARGTLYQRIAAIHAQYGGTVRIAPDELSFTSPSAWPEIYNSRPQLQKTRFHFARPDATRLPETMITASDAEHARLRRLAAPAFLNSGVAEVEPVLQHYTDLLCAQLEEAGKDGSQNLVEWFLWTLNDVIGKLALDQEFECLQKHRMHPWPSFLLGALKMTAVLNQFRRFGLPMKLLDLLMTQDLRDAQDNFFNTAKTAVNERLAVERESADRDAAKKNPDIVGLMLREMKDGEKLTDAEVTANSILIVAGGAETTSTCLSATMYHLCKNQRVMQKLQRELRSTFADSRDITLKACAGLPYLNATIDESLRIFSVASYITPRITPKGGHVIDGEVIPANTYVSMGQWGMGRSSTFFSNPTDFRPERWVRTESSTNHDHGGPEILKPFSLGPRNCLGKFLAIAEVRLVLAKLLWRFDFELDGPQEDWVRDARFYILWQLQPLKVKVTAVEVGKRDA